MASKRLIGFLKSLIPEDELYLKPDSPPSDEREMKEPIKPPKLVEGIDYYREGGFIVMTEEYLRKRGYCCNSGCRHCPYEKAKCSKES